MIEQKYVTYNLCLRGKDALEDLHSAIECITCVTKSNIEYTTCVKIPDINNLYCYQVIAGHKFNGTGFITEVHLIDRHTLQIYTNLPIDEMHKFFVESTFKYTTMLMQSIHVDEDHNLSDEESKMINKLSSHESS